MEKIVQVRNSAADKYMRLLGITLLRAVQVLEYPASAPAEQHAKHAVWRGSIGKKRRDPLD